MGLRDTYKSEAKASAPAKPKASSGTPETPASAVTAPAGAKPTGQSPEDRKKVLAAIQAKMAARQQAGAAVNPPEASEQLTEEKLEPAPDEAAETEEDEDGEAESETSTEPPAPSPGSTAAASKPRARKPRSATAATPAPMGEIPPAVVEAVKLLAGWLLPGTSLTVKSSQ